MIGIVVALHAEARPIVDHFALRPADTASRSRLFLGDALGLVVSGVGKRTVEGAMRALLGHLGRAEYLAWLNIGLAGHRSHRRGRVFLAEAVEDRSSGRVWTAKGTLGLELPAVNVSTVDEPELAYPTESLYDMEAATFCEVATRLTPDADIQVLKVVSDNLEQPVAEIDRELAESLVRDALPALEYVVRAMQGRLGRPD